MTKGRWRLIAAAVIGGLGLTPMVGSWQWSRTSSRLAAPFGTTATTDGLVRLPAPGEVPDPVARYFARSLTEGRPLIVRAELRQEGEFRLGSTDADWRAFRATETFDAVRPAFLWDARIRMAPLLAVLVRDAYVEGHGSIRASMLGVYTVVDLHDDPGLDAGALMRYLAESVWLPTALLPGDRVRWRAAGADSAVAQITDAATTSSAVFRFSADGDILEIFAPDRLREVEGRFEPTPWAVRCRDVAVRDAVRIPLSCEVEWQLPAGPLPYWRGRVVDVRYEY